MAATLGAANPFRYRGYYYDNETSLYYLNSRYYNPEWGRYINADTFAGSMGNLLTHNLFIYCANNPVNAVDPSGHCFMFLFAAIGAVVGGVIGAAVAIANGGEVGDVIAAAAVGAAAGGLIGLTCGAAASVAATAGTITGATVYASTATVSAYFFGGTTAATAVAMAEATAGGTSAAAAYDLFNRALTAVDLGIQGGLTQLQGSVNVANNTATVTLNYIEGSIGRDLFGAIDSLKNMAQSYGVDKLVIQGTFGNETLQWYLNRYFSAYFTGPMNGYTDSYTFFLGK